MARGLNQPTSNMPNPVFFSHFPLDLFDIWLGYPVWWTWPGWKEKRCLVTGTDSTSQTYTRSHSTGSYPFMKPLTAEITINTPGTFTSTFQKYLKDIQHCNPIWYKVLNRTIIKIGNRHLHTWGGFSGIQFCNSWAHFDISSYRPTGCLRLYLN